MAIFVTGTLGYLQIQWQNYSLLEQTLDILIKKLMKISKVDITVDR